MEPSVPVGIRPKIQGDSIDLDNFLMESFSVITFIRNVKFSNPVLMMKLEKIIREFKSVDVEKKQAQQNLDSYHMTDYKSHLIYDEFKQLSDYVLTMCKDNISDHNFKTVDCWGALYKKGDYIKVHNHWPCALSWTYYIKTTKNTSPLVLVNKLGETPSRTLTNPDFLSATGNFLSSDEYILQPEPGDLVIFPSIINHRVPKEKSDDERIAVIGNVSMGIDN